MSYTFLQLQDECLNYGFDANTYRNRIKLWLNEGQRRVARDLNLPGRETVNSLSIVAGTATYTLPTDFQRIMYVYDDTSQMANRLDHMDKWVYEEHDPSTVGQPTAYAVDGLVGTGFQITLWPTPDFAYSIKVRYIQVPTTMSGDNDTTGLSALSTIQFDYEDLLISYALYRAYGAEDDSQQSAYHYQSYQQGIGACKADMLNLEMDTPEQIGGTWSR